MEQYFLSERFTNPLFSPNPTLNTVVTYADTLKYGNETLPSVPSNDGQYKIIVSSNSSGPTGYTGTNLYDKLQTFYNTTPGSTGQGPVSECIVFSIEYDYNTFEQNNIGLEKVWIDCLRLRRRR